MIARTIISIMIFIIWIDTSTAQVLGPRRDRQDLWDAEATVQSCVNFLKYPAYQGSPLALKRGLELQRRCLEGHILDLVEIMFDPDYLSRDQARSKLDSLRDSYEALYWGIFNPTHVCDPNCSQSDYSLHTAQYSSLLEVLLRDLIEVRIEYGARFERNPE